MKCKDCNYSTTRYDTWSCVWIAYCTRYQSSQTVSEYTEDEDNDPEWDLTISECCELLKPQKKAPTSEGGAS